MTDRTLVKLTASESCIEFRTVSCREKSPHGFCIPRSQLSEVNMGYRILCQDMKSFAVISMNAGYLKVRFSWLGTTSVSGVERLVGYEETVVLDYYAFIGFVSHSTWEDGPKSCSMLSVDLSKRRPKIVFNQDGLAHRLALADPRLRRKLGKALMDNFNWPDAHTVILYADFVPYSFLFEEIRRDGKPGINGGLILHDREDLRKAHYVVHT